MHIKLLSDLLVDRARTILEPRILSRSRLDSWPGTLLDEWILLQVELCEKTSKFKRTSWVSNLTSRIPELSNFSCRNCT